MHISICNDELSILFLQISTRNATTSFEFLSNFYWFYLCLFLCSKQVDFLWFHVLFQNENFSIVWCLAPLVQDRLWLWNRWKEKRKNHEEYKVNDAFRQKATRLLLKSNKNAYEEHKRKKRERKCLAKHRKNFVINPIWTKSHLRPHVNATERRTMKSIRYLNVIRFLWYFILRLEKITFCRYLTSQFNDC